jgi:hypothetical protein
VTELVPHMTDHNISLMYSAVNDMLAAVALATVNAGCSIRDRAVTPPYGPTAAAALWCCGSAGSSSSQGRPWDTPTDICHSTGNGTGAAGSVAG